MMMRILCITILIAFGAVSSIRAQDIEPQYIPKQPTTQGPTTTTEFSENITTTTEAVEETSTSTVPDTQTEPISTLATETEETATDSVEDTTTDIVTTTLVAEDTTTSGPTIATSTTPLEVTTPTPDRRRNEGGSPTVCRVILQNGKPYFNWIFRVIIVPEICSYCCRFICSGLEQCHEINPFFCSR